MISTFFATTAAISAPAGAQSTGLTCGGETATIIGTNGADVIYGTSGVDIIAALDGDDVVFGFGGDDVICGGEGNDELRGGKGADQLFGLAGADSLYGGRGPDDLYGGVGADLIFGMKGSDVLNGGADVDELRGGPNSDELHGGGEDDVLIGGSDANECVSQSGITSSCVEKPEVSHLTFSPEELDAQLQAEMLRLINIERDNEGGLLPLTRNAALDGYADAWVEVMSELGLPLDRAVHHSPAFSGSGIIFRALPSSQRWTHAFENVGYTAVVAEESVESIMDRLFYTGNGNGFTTSPSHRCSILETAADEVGVGVHVDANGAVWVSQVFWGDNDSTPAPVASCVPVVGR